MHYQRVTGTPKATLFSQKLVEMNIPVMFKSTVARKLSGGEYVLDYYFVVEDRYTTDLQFAYYLLHVA